MNSIKRLLVCGLLIIPFAAEGRARQHYITFGPMIHFNFSAHAFTTFSYGLEAAYWNYGRDENQDGFLRNFPDLKEPGYSLALGFETDREAIRFYAEPQLGLVYAGLSLGPVFEIPDEGGPGRFGVQGSAWINGVLGADFRYRRIEGRNNQAVGLYAKLPVFVSDGGTTVSE